MNEAGTVDVQATGVPEADGRRWMSVGESTESDSLEAGRACAAAAIDGADPKLLVLFSSTSHDSSELLRGIREVAGEVPLIGCSTGGEISSGGPGDRGAVLMGFGGEGLSAETAAAESASEDLSGAGAAAAACVERVGDYPHRALILLTDGLAGDQQEIVRGAYEAVGAGIPLVGGCAGDDLQMERTLQFHGDRTLSDGVVAAALASEAPLGIGVRHGWRHVGEPMLVTRSSENKVYELDDRPALDAYLDRLDAPEEARRDPAAFTRFAQTHPLGTAARSDEPHARFIGEADFEERSLISIAEVPQGALAWLMEGDSESVLSATDEACDAALKGLEGKPPVGMLAFDCIARRTVLGEEGIEAEIGRVAERASGAPVAGFYTYGEIARTRGVFGFHNQTMVLLAVG